MRRGLTGLLRLSLTGRLEAGPGGGPASCCLEISPFKGRHGGSTRLSMRLRDRPPGPQRRTGRAKYGAADGPPFLFAVTAQRRFTRVTFSLLSWRDGRDLLRSSSRAGCAARARRRPGRDLSCLPERRVVPAARRRRAPDAARDERVRAHPLGRGPRVPVRAALDRAREVGVAGAEAGARDVEARGGRSVTVKAIVRRLAADLWERSQGDLLRMGFKPWPPAEWN